MSLELRVMNCEFWLSAKLIDIQMRGNAEIV